eukprot:c24910_g2_i1 orf=54-455(-)
MADSSTLSFMRCNQETSLVKKTSNVGSAYGANGQAKFLHCKQPSHLMAVRSKSTWISRPVHMNLRKLYTSDAAYIKEQQAATRGRNVRIWLEQKHGVPDEAPPEESSRFIKSIVQFLHPHVTWWTWNATGWRS